MFPALIKLQSSAGKLSGALNKLTLSLSLSLFFFFLIKEPVGEHRRSPVTEKKALLYNGFKNKNTKNSAAEP